MKITARLSEINKLCKHLVKYINENKTYNRCTLNVLIKFDEATDVDIRSLYIDKEITLDFTAEEFLVFAYISAFGYKMEV